MHIKSTGIKTEFIFSRFNGEITDRGDMVEVRTPDNPSFYFGNYLLFERAPAPDQVEAYITLFKASFANNPAIKHVTLMWLPTSTIDAEAEKLLINRGYEMNNDIVLATRKTVQVKPAPKGVDFRMLETDSDWEMALENQVVNRDDSFEEGPYRAFKTMQLANYRAMQDAGLGHWFGAFIGPRLVADMGIFHGDGVSRFQLVGTHPDFRRRGICAALVHHVSQQAVAQHPDNQLVIIAEAGEAAERIYRSLGFESVEILQAACLRPG